MRRLGIGLLIGSGLLLIAWGLPRPSAPEVPSSDLRGSDSEDRPDEAIAWTRQIEVASGEAYQGPWRMNESDFRYVDAPTVALDTDGSIAVAWVEQTARDVVFQRFGPDGEPLRSEPANVSRSPDTFSWLPRVVLGPSGSGEVHLLWQEIVFSGGSHGGEIFYARSTDDGASFTTPLNLSRTPAGAGKGRLTPDHWDNGSLDLALAPDGTLHAAWTEYEGALRVSRSTDGGDTFSDPVAVVEGGAPARGPSLAVGPDGTIHLAWTVGDDPHSDIHMARSDDGGRSFVEARLVASGSGHADAPGVAVDAEGRVHLVFAERSEGRSGPSAIRYTRSGEGGEGFEDAVTLEGPPAAGGGAFPSIALDGDGNPLLLWDLFPEPGGWPMALALAVSDDRGESFTTPVLVPGTGDPELGVQGSLQGLLMRKLAVNDEGVVAIVNSTFNPGERSRVTLFLGRTTP